MMSKILTSKLIVIMIILSVIIIAAAYLLIQMKNSSNNISSTQNFTEQQKKALQLTLEYNVTKTILNGKTYDVNGITIDAYEINDTPITIVYLTVKNMDGSYAGYINSHVDLQNYSVTRIMSESARPW